MKNQKEIAKYRQQQQECRRDYEPGKCIGGSMGKLAYSSNKLILCRYDQSQSGRELCYAEFATLKKDISLCDTLTQEGESVRSGCRIKTMLQRAITENNISFCEQLENEEKTPFHYKGREYKIDIGLKISGCYTELAVINSDIKICEKLKETQDKELCEYHYNTTKQKIKSE